MKLKRYLLAMVVSLFFTACGEGQQAGQITAEEGNDQEQIGNGSTGNGQIQGGEVIFAQWGNIQSLDPHAHSDTMSSDATFQMFETLTFVDQTHQLVPWLAYSWEQLEPTLWEFVLRQGIYFHDGAPFNAYAVVNSFERLLDPQNAFPQANHLNMISSVREVDNYIVHIETYFPFGPLASNLALGAGRIVSPWAIEEERSGGLLVSENPVGTGPWRFLNHIHGYALQMEVNEDYWRGPEHLPNFRYLTFRNVPEAATRLNMLQTGEVHAVSASSADVAFIQGSPDIDLMLIDSIRHSFIAFNTLIPPFDNVNVRRAAAMSVNVDDILTAIEYMGIRSAGPVAPVVAGHSPDVTPLPRDLDQARTYLAEAGLSDGFETTIFVGAGRPIDEIMTAQILQSNLAEIGINASITELEWGTFLDRIGAQDLDIAIVGWTGGLEADSILNANFYSGRAGLAGNIANFNNPTVDALLEAARMEMDTNERHRIYAEISQLVINEAPYKSTFHPIVPFATNGLDNLFVGPTVQPMFSTATLRANVPN